MPEDKIYYATFGREPRYTDVPFAITVGRYRDQIKSMLDRIVRESGLTTSRASPQTRTVTVTTDEIRGGKVVRAHVTTYDAMPPLAPMTEEEFAAEQTAMLADIPPELHGALAYKAYEDGHSSGYEEVINELRELVGALVEPIKAYGKRVWEEGNAGKTFTGK